MNTLLVKISIILNLVSAGQTATSEEVYEYLAGDEPTMEECSEMPNSESMTLEQCKIAVMAGE